MVACIIALFVFTVLSLFSAKYRTLAKEAFRCVFLKMTFRPCEGTLDHRIKAKVLGRLYDTSPAAAGVVGRHFELFSWAFMILMIVSTLIVAQGVYNLYLYGTCDPVHPEQCLITGAFGAQPICPNSYEGINVGPANAKVLIIEFGCFTCPYTKASESRVDNILKKYNGSVRYVYKTFPLSTHNNSREAAAASICANWQGKYLEYRKAIFSEQARVSREGVPYLLSLASGMGMNRTEFEACMSSNATMKQIGLMQEEGLQSRITGTPSFFVNHRYVKAEELEKAVEEELAKK